MDVTQDDAIVTPMPEPIVIPAGLTKAMGEPDRVWVYRLQDGSAYGAVARWNSFKGRKEVRPIIWNGSAFKSHGFGRGRPLYNSDLLAASPVAPVLLVEGEKAADAAPEYLPDGWIVSTWQGGAKAWEQADWSLLSGRSVVIWPDNDAPGIAVADAIRNRLSAMKTPSHIVPVPPVFPDAWDLADPLPEKVTAPMISQLLRRGLRDADVVAGVALETVAEDLDVDEHRMYRPLGYDHQKYYMMNADAQQIYEFTAARLMSEVGVTEVVADADYWVEMFGLKGPSQIKWSRVGAGLMQQCVAAGVYDPTDLRGRGVWMDPDAKGGERIILNSGADLLLTRPNETPREVPYVQLKSNFIYEKSPALIKDHGLEVDYLNTATDADGRMIRELCNLARWESPIYGDLLAGWIATAIVCGALKWRTHAWVTGNQGSGKTTVINEIAGACIGSVGIYPMGATTEAGIRQAVGNDARPVIFDEAEGQKGMEERRQAVIQLMRQSSSEGRGRIMKGSANHTAVAFTMRSSFLMSSIGVGLKEAADLTRTAVLTIKPLEAFTYGERKDLEVQWEKFLSTAHSMRPDMPQRLLARQMSNMFTLKENIETFKEVIASSLGNRRLGDQLGTLLAGAYSLISTKRISKRVCENYLSSMDWTEFTSVKTVREDMALLHHICGSLIKAETMSGVQDRAIGELITAIIRPDLSAGIHPERAPVTLLRYGLKVEANKSGIWVATSASTLNNVMASSEYSEGWQKVLARHPAAKKGEASVRFGGYTSRAIFIPMAEWPILEV